MNKVIIMGWVKSDPEIKDLEHSKVAKFTLVTNDKFVISRGSIEEKSTHFSIEVWNKMAEIVESRVKKGSKLLVEGRFSVEKWLDEEGKMKVKFIIKATYIEIC